MKGLCAEALNKFTPHDEQSFEKYRAMVRGALEVIVDYQAIEADDVQIAAQAPSTIDAFKRQQVLVERPATGARINALFLTPDREVSAVVLWTSSRGCESVTEGDGGLAPDARQLLDAGVAIVAADPFDKDATEMRVIGDPRPVPSLTLGYNRTLVAERTADVLTLLSATRQHFPSAKRIALLSRDSSAPYAAAAAALAGDGLAAVAIEDADFWFGEVKSWRSPQFLPGAVKYGDLPGMLALIAPRPLWIAANTEPVVTRTAYSAAGADTKFVTREREEAAGESITFLLQQLTRP